MDRNNHLQKVIHLIILDVYCRMRKICNPGVFYSPLDCGECFLWLILVQKFKLQRSTFVQKNITPNI